MAVKRKMKRRATVTTDLDVLRLTELYLKGWSQRRIADELGTTHQLVYYHLKKIRAEWKAEALQNIDELQSRELAKLDKLESTYWEAWDRSVLNSERKSERTKTLDDGKQEFTQEIVTEGRDGNPAFLAGIERCIERRCKLLGLDAPVKLEHGGAFAQMLSAAASGGFEPPPPFPKPEQPDAPAASE